MNQRDATCNALLAVLSDRGVNYELNGVTTIDEVLTPEDKATVRSMLLIGFQQGKIDYKAGVFTDLEEKAQKSYISGLVNNWVRKAPEFNNDQTYKAKNPGSRQGSSDESIKAMKGLLAITTDAEARAEIESAITARQEELKPKTEINMDAIPESLRKALGL